MEKIFCIRGAVCSENTADSIVENTGKLFAELVEKNSLSQKDFVSIQFTITPDLDVMNPAAALRKADKNGIASSVPLFCSAEPVIKNMLPKTIRIMLTVYKPEDFVSKPVYMNGAEKLRPDLIK